jgi:hypothetical protein
MSVRMIVKKVKVLIDDTGILSARLILKLIERVIVGVSKT